MGNWLDAYRKGDPAWIEMQSESLIPVGMLHYARENGIILERSLAIPYRNWLPRLRRECRDGDYISVVLADGNLINGEIVMNTASFLAVDCETAVWAIPWLMLRGEDDE
jgi:hypothetical protein